LLQLASADPVQAQREARMRLSVAEAMGDDAAECLALRVLGHAARELARPAEAAERLQQAVAVGERAGLPELAAGARVTLALTHFAAGSTAEALVQVQQALAVLRGVEHAQAVVQRALIEHRMGDFTAALAGYRSALPVLERAQDRVWLARLHNNRGLLHMEQGRLREAAVDLQEAEQSYRLSGQHMLAVQAVHNRGCVASLAGRYPDALRLFDEADHGLAELGCPTPATLPDICRALLSVRLLNEAQVVASRSVRELSEAGMSADLAEAQLLLAQAALLRSDFTAAATAARTASDMFQQQQRPAWQLTAQHQVLQVAWKAGERTEELLTQARRLAVELTKMGWPVQSQNASLTAAHIAVDLGLLAAARHDLDRARGLRRRGTAEVRAQAWHAEALWRAAMHRPQDAARALQAGLRVVDDHRWALGASELRAQASSYAQGLATTGLALARDDGRPSRLLAWAERWRAGALMLPPVTPPDDATLAADLNQLRALTQQQQEPGLDMDLRRSLEREQMTVERTIRLRARATPGLASSPLSRPPQVRELAQALGERALVEFVDIGGDLAAIVVAGARASVHWLGPVTPAAHSVQKLRFALRRLADPGRFAGSAQAASSAAYLAGQQLDALLLQPLKRRLGDRALVIVPTGALHTVPWPALPSCTHRALTVAPSAALWLRASRDSAADGSVHGRVGTVLVAGPRLAEAEREVEAVAAQYDPTPPSLQGPAATVAAVSAALDGAGTAHIAAHASFRADNPQFSALHLADGPLTVYDFERLEHAPQRLVLAACQSGVSAVEPGDELMGLAAAVLNLGTRVLIASVMDVNDAATYELMLVLHRELSAGADASHALAIAQQQLDQHGAAARATAYSFVCFGAG